MNKKNNFEPCIESNNFLHKYMKTIKKITEIFLNFAALNKPPFEPTASTSS